MTAPEGTMAFELKAPGRHNVSNALGGDRERDRCRSGLEAAAEALDAFRPHSRAPETIAPESNGATIIDDTYNANPDSVRAAIAVLANAAGAKWLVLGDMGEVGEQGAGVSSRNRRIRTRRRRRSSARRSATLAPHAVAAFGDGGEHFRDQEALVACS